jgi:hypothetical protein
MQHTVSKFQCTCGQLQGSLSGAALIHLGCHCRDCQTYAHVLGNPDQVLDELGGTDVVTTLQQHLSFTRGKEHLACLSLSEQGLLRWYASCCNTPIANTARDPKFSFVALVHTGLGASGGALEAKLGTSRVPVNPKHARGAVSYSAAGALFATARIVASVLRARVNGSWKHSPFFRPGSAEPVVAPRLLDAAEWVRAATALDAENRRAASVQGGT